MQDIEEDDFFMRLIESLLEQDRINKQMLKNITMPNEDLKPVHTKLNHLHDHLPEGEFKAEVVAILQELNKAMGIGTDEESKKQTKPKP